MTCNEIFGDRGFVGNIVWQKRTSPDARLNLGAAHDFIICYTKTYSPSRQQFNLLPPSEARAKDYKNLDNDKRGTWASVDLTGQIGHATASQFFEITSPTGKKFSPPKDRCWALSESRFLQLVEDERIWFGKDGNSKPRLKKFFLELEGVSTWTWWNNSDVGHNQEATKELKQILDGNDYFETPKPSRLIQKILKLSTDRNSIVLDSFSGSGTTAHAVLNLNKEDGGNRKFILIEMEDYANTITAERVKRVINGYGEYKKPVQGTGGDFSYYELGKSVFLDNEMLNEEIGTEKIEEYVWFSETKLPYQYQEENYLLGIKDQTAYYFYYNTSEMTTLDESFLRTLKTKANQYIIYADNCLLTKELMQKYNIIFKKIPRDITRF